jgi:tetratricopeptide (TPR) repeat protein
MELRRLAFATMCAVAAPALLSAQGGGRGGEPPKNLQVLPKDMPRQQVVAIMNGFTQALGVNCAHCHTEAAPGAGGPPAGGPPPGAPPAGGPPPGAQGGGRGGPQGPQLDFALDDKETKKVAREMLKMVGDINGKYLPATGRTIGERDKVSCETCHHGLAKPQTLRAALANAVEAKGSDSALALYRGLRSRYYGSASYDFSENALNVAATDLARLNQRPAALALLQENLANFDKSASTYQTIAQVQLQGGDTASAVDALKKAVALQPNNPQLRQMMQRLGINP